MPTALLAVIITACVLFSIFIFLVCCYICCAIREMRNRSNEEEQNRDQSRDRSIASTVNTQTVNDEPELNNSNSIPHDNNVIIYERQNNNSQMQDNNNNGTVENFDNEERDITEETINNDNTVNIVKKDCNNEESKFKGTAEEIEKNNKSLGNNN